MDEQRLTRAPTKPAIKSQAPVTPGPFTSSQEQICTPQQSADAPIGGTPVTPLQKEPAPSNCNNPPLNCPTQSTSQNPITVAEKLMFGALNRLQVIYNDTVARGMNQVTIERTAFEAIAKTFQDAHEQVKQARDTKENHHNMHPEDIGERLSSLEKTIKEAFASTRTWAQVVAAPAPEPDRVQEIQQRNLQRKVQQRQERTKLEVTLTMQGANLDTKEQLAKQSHSEITTKLQQAVQAQMENNGPTIHGIQKLKSNDIRIHCHTTEEAEQLRVLKWDEAYAGLTVRQQKRGIVVHGVPTDLIDPNSMNDQELAKELECQNKASEIQVAGMKTLRRKLRDGMRQYSLVVFATSSTVADHCIKHGIYIGHRRFSAEKYAPQFQLVQCYKCQQFGHHATTCRSLHDVCAKCSESHATAQCSSEIHKCAGCSGEHPT